MESIVFIIFIIVLIGALIHSDNKEQEKISLMSPEDRLTYLEEKEARLIEANLEKKAHLREVSLKKNYGEMNLAMICPHFQCIGKIRVKEIKQKKGISGGKATAALLTGGVSLLAVGLSRKEGATKAHCDNCTNTWFF